MEQDNTLVNRVASSGLITIDLGDFFPENEVMSFELSPYLYKGMVLKEKDFRESITHLDCAKFKNQIVAVYCNADALIPMWAYMLVAAKLKDIATKVYYGNTTEAEHQYVIEKINQINPETYKNTRVVVKGCGNKTVPEAAFLAISQKLLPLVKSLMYGEACSSVPIYKNKQK